MLFSRWFQYSWTNIAADKLINLDWIRDPANHIWDSAGAKPCSIKVFETLEAKTLDKVFGLFWCDGSNDYYVVFGLNINFDFLPFTFHK